MITVQWTISRTKRDRRLRFQAMEAGGHDSSDQIMSEAIDKSTDVAISAPHHKSSAMTDGTLMGSHPRGEQKLQVGVRLADEKPAGIGRAFGPPFSKSPNAITKVITQ